MDRRQWARGRDVGSLIVVLLLATALVIVATMLRNSTNEARQVRAQLAVSQDEQACRLRFSNEDDALNRFRDGALLGLVTALVEQPRDPEKVRVAVEYAQSLGPTSASVSDERTRSPQLCAANPAAQPTPHDLPEPPG